MAAGVIWGGVLEQRNRGDIELVAACLMPDHLHLLTRPAASDLIRFTNVLKSWTTRLAWSAGHTGAL
jgi:REP element-mobilizing transposase RayT